MISADAFPYTTVTGMVYDSGTYVSCLQRAMDALNLAQWRRRDEVNGSGSDIRLGIGIGCYVEYTSVGAATYQARGMRSVPAQAQA